MADSDFLISILLKAIDDASPTIAKVTAEIKALKAAARGDVSTGVSPTAALANDIADAGVAARDAEPRVRALRTEEAALGSTLRDTSRETAAAKTNTEALIDSNAELEKQLDKTAESLQKLIDKSKQQGFLTPDQRRNMEEYSRQLESGAKQLDQHNGSYQDYVALAEKGKQAAVDERLAVIQNRDALRQMTSARLDDVAGIQKQVDASEALRDRTEKLSGAYEDFMGRMRDGKVDIDGASTGYRQMGDQLAILSRAYPPASAAAIKFAQAARSASDEAVRLSSVSAMMAEAGGGRGGTTGTEARNLLWGPGHQSIWTLGLPLATFGSLGALAGLGPEHLAMTGIGLAGSAGSAMIGGGLLAGGALGQFAVGAGSEGAVSYSAISDTKALYTSYSNLAAAVQDYGKNSTQAASAQQALNQEMKGSYGSGLGGTKGAEAELGLAKSLASLNAEWDKGTSGARVMFVSIADQAVKTAHEYLPLVADAAKRNLGELDKAIKPFFTFLDGPGKKIFDDLENAFAKRLPTAVQAFTNAFEMVARIIDYVSNTFDKGGFTKHVDDFFEKWNKLAKEMDAGQNNKLKTMIDGFITSFRDWAKLIHEAASDIHELFSNDAHTGDTIVTTLTGMLTKLHEWETSTTGSADLRNIFEVHKNEIVALLQLLPPLISGFSRFYMDVAPPLTQAFTLIVKLFGDLLNAFVNLGNELGPFKGLWVDMTAGVVAFLIAWRRFGSIANMASFFVGLKNDAMGAFEVLKNGRGIVMGLYEAFKLLAGGQGLLGFKNLGSNISGWWKKGTGAAESSTPATEMYDAMVSGGAEAAAAIRAAFVEGGASAAGEVGGAETLGGIPAGMVRTESGLLVPEAAAAASAAETAGTAGAGVEGGLLTAGGLGAPETLGLSLLAAGGVAGLIALLSGNSGSTISGTGLASALGSVSTLTQASSGTLMTGRAGGLSGMQRSGALSGTQAETNQGLDQLVKGLNGVTSASQLSNKQLQTYYELSGNILKQGDITQAQRSGLEQLRKQLDPVAAQVKQIHDTWDSTFSGINVTTGDVMSQVKQTLRTDLEDVKKNMGDGGQSAKTMGVLFSDALSTISQNTNANVPAVAAGIRQINNEIQHELGKLGGLDTAAGRAFNRGLGSNAVVQGQGVYSRPSFGSGPAVNLGAIPGSATGSMQQPAGGGRIIRVAEGGYPEVVLTTDPKYASRQRGLLSQYLAAAPHVVRGYAEGGIAMPPWTGPGGMYGQMGQQGLADVVTMASGLLSAAGAAATSKGAAGTGSVSTAGLSGDLVRIVEQISSQKHWDAQDWLKVIEIESGGSMTARNKSSGAYGIAQFIDGPGEYAKYGGNSTTLVGQLVAMANYIVERYSTPSGALSHENDYGWYAEGGWPDGIPAAATGGVFGAGTPYSAVSGYLSNLNAISSSNQVQGIQPTLPDINLGISVVQTGLQDSSTKLTSFLTKITSSGGLLDQLTQAIQNLFTSISDKITETSLKVTRSGTTVQIRSQTSQDQRTYGAYRTEYSQLGKEQGTISSAEESALTQIASALQVHPSELQGKTPLEIERMIQATPKGSARTRAQSLNNSYTSLASRKNTLADDRAQTLASMYQQEGTVLSDRMTSTQDTLGTAGSGIQTQLTNLQNLGAGADAGGAQQGLTNSLIANANAQIDQYKKVAAQAAKEGNKDVESQAKQQIQQLQSTISTATTTLLQDQVQYVQDTLGTTGSGLQSQVSTMQTLGTLGDPSQGGIGLTNQLIQNTNDQINQYKLLLDQANQSGNTSMVAQINQQIQTLQQSVTQYTSQLLQAQVDFFNQQSQQTMQHLSNQSTLATVMGRGVQGMLGVGSGLATTAAAQMQYGVLSNTGTALQSQINTINGPGGLLSQAQAQGNETLVSQLTTQLDNLNTQLAQNTQAMSDQTVAIQTTMVTWINNMGNFASSTFGSLSSAVQTMGQLTGGINVPLATQIAQANGNVLQSTLGGNLTQLASLGSSLGISGLNLTGLANNPTGLISALAGINMTQAQSGMTQAQQTLFQNLVTSITGNVSAIEQNTVQLQTLNGQLQQPQQWSSSAWSTFRTAFFSGMGSMLPSISSIPHMADGGTIAREGLAYLHPAEVVTPANMVGTGGDTHLHTYINHPVAQFDPAMVARRQAFVLKGSARTS